MSALPSSAVVAAWSSFDAIAFAVRALTQAGYPAEICLKVREAGTNLASLALSARTIEDEECAARDMAWWPGTPVAQSTNELEASLRAEFEAYTAEQGLSRTADADELLQLHRLTVDQRDWLTGFSARWELWEWRDRVQRQLWRAVIAELEAITGERSCEDDRGQDTSEDWNLLGWIEQLGHRVGLDVTRFESLIRAYICVRAGTMDLDVAQLVLDAPKAGA